MAQAVPQIAELLAPPSWRTVDFISDLHLGELGSTSNFNAWQHYMQGTPADAVFILGDLFEAWVGDDAVGCDEANFEDRCARVLAQTAARVPVFFMHGNRDFLVTQSLAKRCGITLLADPTVLEFSGQRWLLSHGDALCIDDLDYLRFRAQVRSPEWQQAFLAKPLVERQAIARGLRQQSQAHQRSSVSYAEVDAATARQWLVQARASTLIHGHTHRPAVHDLHNGLSRVVLSDWDAGASPPRAQVLRLSASGLQHIALL